MGSAVASTRTGSRGAVLGGRFEVVAGLGRGAMASVYRVREIATGEELALKRLSARGSSRRRAATRLRFRREFHTMAGLAHPRIVRVRDYGVDGEQPWYTMELLDGEDLAKLGVTPYRRACRLLRDVASALAFLHSRGLIHRDVAPRNVRCTSDGAAKLIDFGVLATPGVVGEVAGTPTCMAPEGPRGQPLDHRVDLYGLGALGYWLLTGRHAYPVSGVGDLERAWAHRPVPPSSLDASVPEPLDDLVMALLSLDRRARPRSAAEVVDRLGGIAGLEPEPEVEVTRGYLSTSSLIGREKELRRIRKRIDGAGRGMGTAVTIEASSGTGKSRLLREVGVEAQLAGSTVVHVDAGSVGRGPYALLRGIARRLLEVCPEDALDSGGLRVAVLGRIVPELREVFPSTPLRPPPTDPHEDRVLLQSEAARWISDVARRRPLTLLVDDVQRADEASSAVVASIAHAAGNQQLLVVVARRTDEPARAEAAIAAVRDAGIRIRLKGLDVDDVRDLVRGSFGEVPNVDRLGTWVHAAAGGSPLRCSELLYYLVDTGAVRYAEGTWLIPDSVEELTPPRGLEATMDARIAGLGARARSLAEALAIRGGDLSLETCVALADDDEDVVFAAMDELVAEEVLVGDSARYTFRHDGLREALLRNMGAERARELHLRAGRVLEEQSSGDTHDAEVGWHLLEGGEEDRGAALLERAGRRLYDSQSFADALPPLEAALRVYERTGRSERRRLELRQMLTRAGVICDRGMILRYADDSIASLRHWSGMRIASRLEPKVGRVLGLVLGVTWAMLRWPFVPRRKRGPFPFAALADLVAIVNYASSVHSLGFDVKRARDNAELLRPLSAFWRRIPGAAYLLARSFMHMALGRWEDARETSARAGESIDRDRLTPLSELDRRMAAGGVHYLHASVDAMQMRPTYTESLRQLDQLDLRFFDASIRMARLLYHRTRGEEELALRAQAEGEMLSVQLGSAWIFDAQLQWLSSVGYALTRDVSGLKRVIAGLERLRDDGHLCGPFLEAARSEYHRERGDLELSAEALERGWSALQPGELFAQQLLHCAKADLHLAAGDFDQARAAAREGLELGEDPRLAVVAARVRLVCILALAESGRGDHEAAARRLEREIGRVRPDGSPTLLGSLHEARARVALVEGDMVSFEHHRLECTAWFRSTGNTVLLARSERLAERGEAARVPRMGGPLDDVATVVQSGSGTGSGSSDSG